MSNASPAIFIVITIISPPSTVTAKSKSSSDHLDKVKGGEQCQRPPGNFLWAQPDNTCRLLGDEDYDLGCEDDEGDEDDDEDEDDEDDEDDNGCGESFERDP